MGFCQWEVRERQERPDRLLFINKKLPVSGDSLCRHIDDVAYRVVVELDGGLPEVVCRYVRVPIEGTAIVLYYVCIVLNCIT